MSSLRKSLRRRSNFEWSALVDDFRTFRGLEIPQTLYGRPFETCAQLQLPEIPFCGKR